MKKIIIPIFFLISLMSFAIAPKQFKLPGTDKNNFFGWITPLGWSKNGLFAIIYDSLTTTACEIEPQLKIFDIRKNEEVLSKNFCFYGYEKKYFEKMIRKIQNDLANFKIKLFSYTKLSKFPMIGNNRKIYKLLIHTEKDTESNLISKIKVFSQIENTKMLIFSKIYKNKINRQINKDIYYFSNPYNKKELVIILSFFDIMTGEHIEIYPVKLPLTAAQ